MDFKSSIEDLGGDLAPSPGDSTKNNSSPLESLTVRMSRGGCDPDWDSFLDRCPGAHHEQTSLWGEVKACYGWLPLRIVVSRRNRIVGGVQLLIRSLGRWGRIGYIARGPSAVYNDPELINFIIAQLDRAAVTEKLAYLVVMPPYNGRIFEPSLIRLGFRRKPNHLPPGGVMSATLLMDLSADLSSLLAGMKKRMRQHIRRAEQAGVTVREGTALDVETFQRLMWALCERRGTSPTPPQKDFFEHLWQVFERSGFVRLFIAELEGRAIAAALTFPFGNMVRIWKVGWAGDHSDSSPNAMLYWEAIRWSKLNGYRFFDFVEIENGLARTLQQGDLVDKTPIDGTSFFKIGFGGSPVLLPEPYYRFYQPLLRVFAQAGGSTLIESSFAARVLKLIWNQKTYVLVSGKSVDRATDVRTGKEDKTEA